MSKTNKVTKALKPLKPADIEKFITDEGLTLERRDYQLRIVAKTLNYYLCEDIESVMIESPTGSGKTVMGQLVGYYLWRKGFIDGNSWVAMRRTLLTQAVKSAEKFGMVYPLIPVSMFEKNPGPSEFMTVDECQHDATDSNANIHAKVKPKKILGLSATPFRADRASLFFRKIVKDANIRILIKAGWLSQFDHYNITDWKPHTVATIFLENPEKWGKSVVFFRTEEECLEFQTYLLAHEITCEMVSAKTDKDAQLDAFERGEIQVLVNMMILTEGFDSPSLQTVFIRPSTKGPVMQMGGRVLRLFKDGEGNNIIKNIVQAGTKYSFLKVAPARKMYNLKNGVFEEFIENKQIEEIHTAAYQAVIQGMVQKTPEEIQRAMSRIGWGKTGVKKKRKFFDPDGGTSEE
jgi:superfamily II DNA or RNA helicase